MRVDFDRISSAIESSRVEIGGRRYAPRRSSGLLPYRGSRRTMCSKPMKPVQIGIPRGGPA